MADLIENHRRHRGLIGLLTVLGALLPGTRAQHHIKLERSNITLVPKYTGDLKEITWRINGSIVVETELNPQRMLLFKLPSNRVTIHETIGALTISNLTINDSGSYTAQVLLNNGAIDKTDIRLTIRAPLAMNKTVGDDVTLVPEYTGDPSEIKWTVNGTKLVDMKPWENDAFYRLQDRATISDTDGSLTIRDLTIEDSGFYKAEVTVNNAVQETGINVTVSQSSGLPGWNIALIVFLVVAVIAIIILVLWWYCRNKKCPKDIEINKISGLVGCITVKCLTSGFSSVDESRGLLKDHLKSLCLTIHGVKKADHGDCTAEALLSNGKKCTFTKETGGAVIIKSEDDRVTLTVPDTEDMTKLVWKKGGVTHFEWAVSGLKLHTNSITLEPRSVTVNNAEGKASYTVDFQLEERPESRPISSVTFHPINLTGKTQITWKKDGQPMNIGGNRIQPGPNGDLTIHNATSEDQGKYTIQCEDKKLDQEFFLCL